MASSVTEYEFEIHFDTGHPNTDGMIVEGTDYQVTYGFVWYRDRYQSNVLENAVLETGSISDNDGTDITASNVIRSQNLVEVMPDTMYRPADDNNGQSQSAISTMRVFFYDEDGNYIVGSAAGLSYTGNTSPKATFQLGKQQYYFSTPSTARYMRITINRNNTNLQPLAYAYTRVGPTEHLSHYQYPCSLQLSGVTKKDGEATGIRWKYAGTMFDAEFNSGRATCTFKQVKYSQEEQDDVYVVADRDTIETYQNNILNGDGIVRSMSSNNTTNGTYCKLPDSLHPVLILHYKIADPELIHCGDQIFQMYPATLESPDTPLNQAHEDLTSREFITKFNLFMARRPETGSRYEYNARIKYELVENYSQSVVWTIYHDDLEFQSLDEIQYVKWMPHHFGQQYDNLGLLQLSQYSLRVSYGTKANPVTLLPREYVAPKPQIYDVEDMQIALRMKGESLELTGEQYLTHSLGRMYGTEVTLWWTNPTITHAAGLRVNFQILIARNSIPDQIEEANILTIIPDPVTTGNQTSPRRFFPGSTDASDESYVGNTYKTFFCYNENDGVLVDSEDLPHVVKVSNPTNQRDDFAVVFGQQQEEESSGSGSQEQGEEQSGSGSQEEEDYSKYLYGYRITMSQIEEAVHPDNYDKIWFSVRPVIEAVSNTDLVYTDPIPSYLHDIDTSYWRPGSEYYPLTNECTWQHFYFIKDFHVRFYTDEYRDQNGKVVIGNPSWRTCRMMYCYDEHEPWIPVFARYYDQSSEQWKQC